MKHKERIFALITCAALLASALGACDNSSVTDEDEVIVSAAEEHSASELDLTGATTIALSGSSAEISGSGAEVEDGVITITSGGTYAVSGTLSEGRIIVYASGADVTLALNGASITCSYGSPIYIYKSSSTTIYLVDGTENTLADGSTYTYEDSISSAADEEPNACLYSKSDLIIEGAGALTVNASFNNGITSKDTLCIYDGTINVTAVNHGINGKDSNTINSAVINVSCGGDAVRSTNDSDASLGWINIANSVLNLTAGEDGIQAETTLNISDSTLNITTAGGSSGTISSDASAKGIKAGGDIVLVSGTYTLDCCDDAVHSNSSVTIHDGTFTITTGDDGVHADDTLTVYGGTIDILTSYEGLEGSDIEISGGEISIVSSDDGINAAGGADSSGFGGFGNGNTFSISGTDHYITISGGYITIDAQGDGIDSNGGVTMTGGTVLVSSTGSADGALDYETGFYMDGGTLLAACASNMAQAPSSASQYTVSISFNSTLSAGTYVQLLGDDGQEFVIKLPVRSTSMIFSSPELTEGATYTISYGGEYSGTGDIICSGGEYTGGSVLTELTISDYLTTYGQIGMGGSMGGGMIGEPGRGGGFGKDGWTMQDNGRNDGSFGGKGQFSGDFSEGSLPDGMPEDIGGTAPDGMPEGMGGAMQQNKGGGPGEQQGDSV